MLIGAMREYFRGLKLILLFVIVAFIATSFLYFGSDSLRMGNARSSSVASVNGEEIPPARFQRVQRNYIEYYRRAYQQDITPEMADRLGLTQQVINDLVQEALVLQQAKREGITVSDEELRLRIQMIPAFQEEGRFSRERYLAQLKQIRIEPSEFEAEVRREMLRQKMEALVKDGIKVSDVEVEQVYSARFERIRADWAQVETGPLMAQVSVSDADAEAYLKGHEAQFTRPERRRIQYGPNELSRGKQLGFWADILHRCRSPLVVQLLVIALVSGIIGEIKSTAIVSAMVLLSVGLSFILDRRSGRAVEALGKRVQSRTLVLRDGEEREV